MANYGNISGSTQTGKDGGYKPTLYFVEVEDVATWQRPTVPGTALGDTVKIDTAHILATGKVTHSWDAKKFSAKVTGAPIGDLGAQQILWTAVVVINGDNAPTQEQIIRMLNDNKVVFLKDADCINNNGYIQLGDDCNPVNVSPAFDSKDNGATGGQKEYTLTITSLRKYFYLAALPAAA